jgi:hypothetical protein
MQKKHIQFLGHITNIHQVLAHSYLIYFAAAIFGFIVDYFYPFRIFGGTIIAFGPVLLIVGTALIYWAQHTSEMTAKNRKEHGIGMTPADFMYGPYKYTRSPHTYRPCVFSAWFWLHYEFWTYCHGCHCCLCGHSIYLYQTRRRNFG